MLPSIWRRNGVSHLPAFAMSTCTQVCMHLAKYMYVGEAANHGGYRLASAIVDVDLPYKYSMNGPTKPEFSFLANSSNNSCSAGSSPLGCLISFALPTYQNSGLRTIYDLNRLVDHLPGKHGRFRCPFVFYTASDRKDFPFLSSPCSPTAAQQWIVLVLAKLLEPVRRDQSSNEKWWLIYTTFLASIPTSPFSLDSGRAIKKTEPTPASESLHIIAYLVAVRS